MTSPTMADDLALKKEIGFSLPAQGGSFFLDIGIIFPAACRFLTQEPVSA